MTRLQNPNLRAVGGIYYVVVHKIHVSSHNQTSQLQVLLRFAAKERAAVKFTSKYVPNSPPPEFISSVPLPLPSPGNPFCPIGCRSAYLEFPRSQNSFFVPNFELGFAISFLQLNWKDKEKLNLCVDTKSKHLVEVIHLWELGGSIS